MDLYLNPETETAVLNFRNCFKFVLGKEIIVVNRLYFDDDIELCQSKNRLLDEIDADFESAYPSSRKLISSFFDSLHQLGFAKVDDIASKVGKRIFEYLKSGVTLQSSGSNIPPTLEELDRYASFKGKELIAFLLAEEFSIGHETDDYEKLNDYAFLISASIVNFFRQGYNVSGPAINAAFVTGVGVLMLWAEVK